MRPKRVRTRAPDLPAAELLRIREGILRTTRAAARHGRASQAAVDHAEALVREAAAIVKAERR